MAKRPDDAPEFEITPEMIEAGVDAIFEIDEMSTSEARQISRAVLEAAVAVLGAQKGTNQG